MSFYGTADLLDGIELKGFGGQGSKLKSAECLSDYSDTIRENSTLHCLVEGRPPQWYVAGEKKARQSYLGNIDP